MRAAPLIERFLAKVAIDPISGCWIWTGFRNEWGYGMIIARNPRRTLIASRAAFELFKGPIPKGMKVCHRCDTPACANPSDLFLGSDLDNTRDRQSKGRPAGGAVFNSKKSHCPQGHEYAGANLKINKRGDRTCKTCGAARTAEYRRLKKGREL